MRIPGADHAIISREKIVRHGESAPNLITLVPEKQE
jgi:hypothetical protein